MKVSKEKRNRAVIFLVMFIVLAISSFYFVFYFYSTNLTNTIMFSIIGFISVYLVGMNAGKVWKN